MRVALKEGLLTSIDPAADPRLLGARCLDCGQLHFPRSESCPYCSGGRCDSVPLGNRGSLHLFTSVGKPPPGYRGQVPYGLGVVELPEGIRLISRLTEPRCERLECGMPVHLVLEDLCTDERGDTVVGWAFEPETAR